MAAESTIVYRVHATLRMVERGITRMEIEDVIAKGETIENYSDDKPYPSRLLFGVSGDRPLHVVVAWNETHREWIVITVYEPNPIEWDVEFKRRLR